MVRGFIASYDSDKDDEEEEKFMNSRREMHKKAAPKLNKTFSNVGLDEPASKVKLAPNTPNKRDLRRKHDFETKSD